MFDPFDLFSPPTSSHRGQGFMKSMHIGAKRLRMNTKFMQSYEPRPGSTLVLYGMGGPDRWPHATRHPGTVIAWDVGYWERNLPLRERKCRVSFNGLHPPKYVMKGPSPGPERWESSGLEIRTAKLRNGPVMLVGNGPKSNAVGAAGWTAAKSRELRRAGYRILYRPKPDRPIEPGVVFDELSINDPIESALAKVSLVVCRHSNVAVDACRMGVPVVCDDGAAAAVYPNSLAGQQPSEELRRDFLHRLAWWQWSRNEAENGQAWEWLLGVEK